jgi:hypothetical protein
MSKIEPVPYRDVTNLTAAIDLARGFKNGLYGREVAIDLLQQTNEMGALWAAELSIESAERATDLEDVSTCLDQAEELLDSALRIALDNYGGRMNYICAKARVLSAYMPVYRDLLLRNQMPSPLTIEDIFNVTLLQARDLSSEFKFSSKEDIFFRKDSMGVLSELAVLLILQRFSIYIAHDGSERLAYFPRLSTFSKDQNNSAHSLSDTSSDIETVTELPSTQTDGRLEPISANSTGLYICDKIQVKTSVEGSRELTVAEGFSRVYINSGLVIEQHDGNQPSWLTQTIISELLCEPGDRKKIGPILDERTERLLSFLDAD